MKISFSIAVDRCCK